MTQIDIYDLLTPDDLTAVNFRTMTVEEIAQTLGARLGLEFKFNGFFYEHQAEPRKGFVLSFKVSTYSAIDPKKNGEPFLSCSWTDRKTMAGCGKPCDSLSEAYAFFNRAKERASE